MSKPTTHDLRSALCSDLRKTAPAGLEPVVNDVVRRFFTARVTGAVLEFGHHQPDREFWTGAKHYGSGSRSRIRVPRTPVAEEPKAKAPRARKNSAKAAAETAAA